MSPQMHDPKRRKPEARISIRITHLFVLSAFTTAQPIYDLLTRHPEFLPAHQTEKVDIFLLVLGCPSSYQEHSRLSSRACAESIRSSPSGPTWLC